MVTAEKNIEVENIWRMLEEVCDPEVPVLSVVDLGIIRDVQVTGENAEITITPTYSGCPAMDAIAFDIRLKLMSAGYKKIKISNVLSPVWTTDWMTANGKRKLKEYGIAPPAHSGSQSTSSVICPQCGSRDTNLLSQFGSTACKSLYQCNECREPFDHFKCH